MHLIHVIIIPVKLLFMPVQEINVLAPDNTLLDIFLCQNVDLLK